RALVSLMRVLSKYPEVEFPSQRLLDENRRRGRSDPEFELADAGVFVGSRYFDVFADYAKAAPDDLLLQLSVHNRAPAAAVLHVLPQLWFPNTWSWGRTGEGYWPRGVIAGAGERALRAEGAGLGVHVLELDQVEGGEYRGHLFCENETNVARLFGGRNAQPYTKDAFHDYVVRGAAAA